MDVKKVFRKKPTINEALVSFSENGNVIIERHIPYFLVPSAGEIVTLDDTKYMVKLIDKQYQEKQIGIVVTVEKI